MVFMEHKEIFMGAGEIWALLSGSKVALAYWECLLTPPEELEWY